MNFEIGLKLNPDEMILASKIKTELDKLRFPASSFTKWECWIGDWDEFWKQLITKKD